MLKRRGLLTGVGLMLAMSLFGCQNRGGIGGSSMLVNSPAPDFTLSDLNGKRVSFSQYKGKVVVLDFWATWCPPCRKEIPHFIDLNNRYQGKGLVMVGVALDDEGSKVVRPFVDEYKINYTVLLGNSDVQKAYGGIQGIPTTFVIDKKGKVAGMYVGYEDPDVVEKKIESLL